MVPVAVVATLAALMWFFHKDIPANYDLAQLKAPAEAIYDRATFITAWWVLGLLLVGFFWLEHLGVPISAVAAVRAVLLLVVAARGHKISTREVLGNQAIKKIYVTARACNRPCSHSTPVSARINCK